jgi:ATP-dependent DNA helicase RecG
MENDITEWKLEWKPDHLKVIASFANRRGGTVLIGIDDDDTVVGVSNAAELLKSIPDAIATSLGIDSDVTLREIDGRDVVAVAVERSEDPVLLRGRAYVRCGSTVQELSGARLRDFHMRAKPLSWADVPVASLSPDDIGGQAFDAFRERAETYGRLTKAEASLPAEALLDKLELVSGGRPTRAAAILFRNDALKISRGACIRIGRLSGANLVFQDELSGPMYLVADQAVELITSKYCAAPITYDGIVRVENAPYPKGALREAVLNAVINADYSENEPIMIRVYDGYLDITNAGGLPDGASLGDIMENHRSMPRNRGMALAFRAAHYVESFGRGFELMTEEYRKRGASLPGFDAFAGGFVAKLPNIVFEKGIVPRDMDGSPVSPADARASPEALSNGEARIYGLLREGRFTTAEELAIELGASVRTAEKYLGLLESRGLAKRDGDRGDGAWSAADGSRR